MLTERTQVVVRRRDVALNVSAPAIKKNALSVFNSGEYALKNPTQKNLFHEKSCLLSVRENTSVLLNI